MVTVTVLHDMNYAYRFADHLTVMHQGKVHSGGGNHLGDGQEVSWQKPWSTPIPKAIRWSIR